MGMGLLLYPLTFCPAFRSYIWGGRNLAKWGRELPAGVVAESWEISGYPGSLTAVNAGPLAGQTLPELMSRLGLDLVGRRNANALKSGRFPLLIKLLDAQEPLSVQVHPPDAYARRHEAGEPGKSEMWYFLAAQPAARIIYGLRAGATPERLRDALAAGELERYLHYLPVRADDAVLIEAGALHALLGGVVAVEIQQTSDVTYRVYDWNRLGADGRPRPLHIAKALDVIDFGLIEPGLAAPRLIEQRAGARRESLCRCAAFSVERLRLGAGAAWEGACEGETFEIWGCVAGGAATLSWAGGVLALPPVQFALLPAALGRYRLEAAAPATLLRVWAGA
jgi:mannose-6-phosphate isomerase